MWLYAWPGTLSSIKCIYVHLSTKYLLTERFFVDVNNIGSDVLWKNNFELFYTETTELGR